VQRISDTSRSLAVYDLNPIGASTQRQVDLLHDPRNRFVHGHPMEIDPLGRRVPFRARGGRSRMLRRFLALTTVFGWRDEVLFPTGNSRVVYLNAVAAAAAGLYDDPAFFAKREHDDGAADFKRQRPRSPRYESVTGHKVTEAKRRRIILSGRPTCWSGDRGRKGYGIKVGPRWD
jgi:hypothetical protein